MDDDLRTLERRWRESGTPDDAARLLTARLRAGDLVPRDVAAVEVTLRAEHLDHVDGLELAARDLAATDPLLLVRRDGLRPAVVLGAPTVELLERAVTALVAGAQAHRRSPTRVVVRQVVFGDAEAPGRFVRQTSCAGWFAEVTLRLGGDPTGDPVRFTDASGLSPEWVGAVRDELPRLAWEGDGSGAPFEGVGVTLVAGREHPVDSRERAFRRVAAIAWTEGLGRLQRGCLEPRVGFRLEGEPGAMDLAAIALAEAEGQVRASSGGLVEGDLPLALVPALRARLETLGLGGRVRLEAGLVRRFAPVPGLRAEVELLERREARRRFHDDAQVGSPS